jgi:hypothetical protein
MPVQTKQRCLPLVVLPILLVVVDASGVSIAFSAETMPIRSVALGGVYGFGDSTGDEWSPTWADDGMLYSANNDGHGFSATSPNRCIAFSKLAGKNPYHLTGIPVNQMIAAGMNYGDKVDPKDGASWKTMNAYCADGVLYMFVTRCWYWWDSGDPRGRHIFANSSIIKSLDHGVTWTRSEKENFDSPMFRGKRFGAPYFVLYGQNGSATADNADKYVYAVSNDGHFEHGDNVILGRVARRFVAKLDAADWQFYTGGAGGDGMQDHNWSSHMDHATPIISDYSNCSMTGMTYLPALGRYILVEWHYGSHRLQHSARTILDFLEAPAPWGPWRKFHSTDAGDLGWYCPSVGQEFQTANGSRRLDCFLYATGNSWSLDTYKLFFMPISLYAAPQPKSVHDNFADGKLSAFWKTTGGSWNVSGRVLSQTGAQAADPKKAILCNSGVEFGENHVIKAKLKVDSWTGGDAARAGVGLFSDSSTFNSRDSNYGKGYNLLFVRDFHTVQFLDDYLAWGPSYRFDWSLHTWYWFELKMDSDVLYGRIWQDGAAEPTEWPYSWHRSGRKGFPALNGGTNHNATASFADVSVTTLPAKEVVRSIGCTVTARGDNPPNEGKENAFDGYESDKWYDGSRTSWLQCQFANHRAYIITKYKMTSAYDVPERDPASWTLKGSNDGTHWTNLDSRADQHWTNRCTTNIYAIANKTAYKYYKFDDIASRSNGIQVADIELIEELNGSNLGQDR